MSIHDQFKIDMKPTCRLHSRSVGGVGFRAYVVDEARAIAVVDFVLTPNSMYIPFHVMVMQTYKMYTYISPSIEN
jgi:hypothetical protein